MDEMIVIAGGTLPEDDRPALGTMGVKGVFGPGTPTSEIVEFIRQAVVKRDQARADS